MSRGGISSAVPIGRDGVVREHVFAWYPIEDSREWKAQSLRAYVEGRLMGKPAV